MVSRKARVRRKSQQRVHWSCSELAAESEPGKAAVAQRDRTTGGANNREKNARNPDTTEATSLRGSYEPQKQVFGCQKKAQELHQAGFGDSKHLLLCTPE